MIMSFVYLWEVNKHKLEQYFRDTNQSEYRSYRDLVKLLFTHCLNSEDGDTYVIDSNQIHQLVT